MGLPPGARGILTSGGSLSSFSAVVTARHERLGEAFQDGVLYFSEETHYCVTKAARLAGFPRASLRALPTDARYRLQPAALADGDPRGPRARPAAVPGRGQRRDHQHRRDRPAAGGPRRRARARPLGPRGRGLRRLLPPGARRRRRSCAGSRRCDSITLDPHKGLFLPYGLGALLVRDGDALARVHREGASYVQDVTHEGSLGLRRPVARALARLPRAAPVAAADAPRPRGLPRAARREARARPLGVPGARERPALRARSTSRSSRSSRFGCARRRTRPTGSGPELLRRVNARSACSCRAPGFAGATRCASAC